MTNKEAILFYLNRPCKTRTGYRHKQRVLAEMVKLIQEGRIEAKKDYDKRRAQVERIKVRKVIKPRYAKGMCQACGCVNHGELRGNDVYCYSCVGVYEKSRFYL